MSYTADLVVVGSLNADLTARVRRHPSSGEALRATELTTGAGGKGANQAVAAARLGARTAMIGRVGADAHADVLLSAARGRSRSHAHPLRQRVPHGNSADRGRGFRGEHHPRRRGRQRQVVGRGPR